MARKLAITPIILCFVLGLTFFFSKGLWAIPLMGSGSAARAGAGVAAINVHEVYTSNPSTMVGSKYYSVGGGYTSDGATLQASIVDTKTSELAGAVLYHHQTGGARYEDPNWKTNGLHVSLAGAASDQISLGITGKYIWYEQLPVGGLFTFSPLLMDQRFDLDVGGHFRVSQAVALGIVYRNMLIQKHIEVVPLPDLVVGVALSPVSDLGVYADAGRWVKPSPVDNHWNFAMGAEYRFVAEAMLRAGYRIVTDRSDLQTLSAGIVFKWETVQLAYSAMFYVNSVPFQNTHGVSFALMF